MKQTEKHIKGRILRQRLLKVHLNKLRVYCKLVNGRFGMVQKIQLKPA